MSGLTEISKLIIKITFPISAIRAWAMKLLSWISDTLKSKWMESFLLHWKHSWSRCIEKWSWNNNAEDHIFHTEGNYSLLTVWENSGSVTQCTGPVVSNMLKSALAYRLFISSWLEYLDSHMNHLTCSWLYSFPELFPHKKSLYLT